MGLAGSRGRGWRTLKGEGRTVTTDSPCPSFFSEGGTSPMRIWISLLFLAMAVVVTPAFGGTIGGVTASSVANAPQFIAGEATGPDGNVWFVAWKDNAIGRLSPDGSIKLFHLP